MSTATIDLPTQTDPLHSEQLCGLGTIIIWNPDKQEYMLMQAPCKSWTCPICGPRKAKVWAAKLHAGRPWLAMTLTAKYEVWKTPKTEARRQKKAFAKLVMKIRKRFGFFEYAAVWELQQNGMPHIHILARAPYIPHDWLRRTWCNLTGAFMVDVHRVGRLDYETHHSTKSLGQPALLRAYQPERLMGKQTSQTAEALRPLRIVVLSRNYLNPPGLPPESPKPSRLLSAFTLHDCDDVLYHLTMASPGETRYDRRTGIWHHVPADQADVPTPLELVSIWQRAPP